MNCYVITGGASSGKSSLIMALELMGEYIVTESAESVARYMNALGIESPHIRKDYQPKVLDLFLQREERILKLNPDRIFYDRSVYDQLDYVLKNGFKIFPKLQEQLDKVKYDKVFFLESLGKLEKIGYRCESDIKECEEMGKRHFQTYNEYNCQIIRIPNMPLKERVEHILSYCE